MALVTIQDVKEYMKLDMTVTAEDNMITHLINAAQKEMEQTHDRIFEYSGTDIVEKHSGKGEDQLFLKAYPIVSITQVKVDGNVLSSSDYQVNAKNGVLYGPWTKGVENIEVTYKGGYYAETGSPPPGVQPLPADLKHEMLERVAYLYDNRRGRR